MDAIHGILLLVIGLPITFLAFALIVYVETPEEDKEKDLSEVQKSIRKILEITHNANKNQ